MDTHRVVGYRYGHTYGSGGTGMDTHMVLRGTCMDTHMDIRVQEWTYISV